MDICTYEIARDHRDVECNGQENNYTSLHTVYETENGCLMRKNTFEKIKYQPPIYGYD